MLAKERERLRRADLEERSTDQVPRDIVVVLAEVLDQARDRAGLLEPAERYGCEPHQIRILKGAKQHLPGFLGVDTLEPQQRLCPHVLRGVVSRSSKELSAERLLVGTFQVPNHDPEPVGRNVALVVVPVQEQSPNRAHVA